MSPELRTLYRPGGTRQFSRRSPEGLEKSVSKCHDVNQVLIRVAIGMQRDLMNLKLRNSIIVAGITGAIARGPEIWHYIAGFFR